MKDRIYLLMSSTGALQAFYSEAEAYTQKRLTDPDDCNDLYVLPMTVYHFAGTHLGMSRIIDGAWQGWYGDERGTWAIEQ